MVGVDLFVWHSCLYSWLWRVLLDVRMGETTGQHLRLMMKLKITLLVLYPSLPLWWKRFSKVRLKTLMSESERRKLSRTQVLLLLIHQPYQERASYLHYHRTQRINPCHYLRRTARDTRKSSSDSNRHKNCLSPDMRRWRTRNRTMRWKCRD